MNPYRILRALPLALLAWLIALAPVAPASTGVPLTTRLASALAVPHVDHSHSAAVAVDLESGRILFARNADKSLAPASTEKLALSFALLTALGPAYRIETRVYGLGSLRGSTWHGDVVLKGYGDPMLSTRRLRSLARQVRALGIRRVAGSVLGDESFFDTRRTAAGWKPSFYLGESPPLSALVVDRAIYRGRLSENPALASASRFRAVLHGAGIAVARPSGVGVADSADTELARIASPRLSRILRLVNRDSDNFTAELLLKHLGAVSSGSGTTAAGAAAVRRALASAEVPLARVRFVDGSGLSRLDRLTGSSLVAILVAAWTNPGLRRALVPTLAIAGETGTLERRLADGPAEGLVLAKTGTTDVSSALAGYVGDRYAFAVLHNGALTSPWRARLAQDRFVTALARFS